MTIRLNIVGIDQSLTHTAMQHVTGVQDHWEDTDEKDLVLDMGRHAIITDTQSGPTAKKRKTKPKGAADLLLDHAVHRIHYIAERWAAFLSSLERHGRPGTIYMEGYAMGSSFGREALGELGGAIKCIAYARGWDVYVCAPMSLKKFVLGTGKGEKDLLMARCVERWKYMPSDNNDSDAYALARLGVCHQLGSALKTCKATTEVISKLTYYPPHPRQVA